MSHNCSRIELGKEPSQSEGKAWVEPLRGLAAGALPESPVDLHLGRTVEKAKQTVANIPGLVEPIDQKARCALRSSSARRRYDVDDQSRTTVLAAMRCHHPASLPD
jgi:hypothetical protein